MERLEQIEQEMRKNNARWSWADLHGDQDVWVECAKLHAALTREAETIRAAGREQ